MDAEGLREEHNEEEEDDVVAVVEEEGVEVALLVVHQEASLALEVRRQRAGMTPTMKKTEMHLTFGQTLRLDSLHLKALRQQRRLTSSS